MRTRLFFHLMKRTWLSGCLLFVFVSTSVFAQTVTTTDLEVPTIGVATNYASVTTPSGSFHLTFGPNPNSGDSSRPDQAFTLGWNATHDGFRERTGEPALMWRFEDYYHPTGTDSYMESHLQYVSAAGVVKRPYGLQINRGTDAIAISETGDSWSYLGSNGTQYVKLMPGTVILANGTSIVGYTNNVAFSSQINAAGTASIPLPFIDATSRTVIDNGGYGATFGGSITATGTISGGNVVAKYQDVAEWVRTKDPLAPGTVVVVGTSNSVEMSHVSYDTSVVGVVSAKPGVILGEAGHDKVLVAQSGRVRVKVDARYGAIHEGDLLVTSPTPGVAMKSKPLAVGGETFHRPGTLLGKALEPLTSGDGEILVLLTLQ